jgi:hypothetical protein
MWTPQWLIKWISDLPTAAAQKEKYETKIMLLDAKHDAEKKEFEANRALLETQNRALHFKIDELNQKLHENDLSLMTLGDMLEDCEDRERDREGRVDPPLPGAHAGL